MNNSVTRKEIIRFITGECSEEERRRVEAWANEAPENRETVRQYQRVWGISENMVPEQDEDRAWQKLSQRISEPSHMVSVHKLNSDINTGTKKKDELSDKIRYQSWLLRIAAVFLLTVSVLYVLYVYNNNLSEETYIQPEMKEVAAGRGERMHVTFSDGTSVVLNSSSVVRFPSRFDGDSREVELKGEAFFSVARKEKMPFLVHTNETVIQVLGTKFNVSAYPDDERTEVVVADGKVAVRSESVSSGRTGSSDQTGSKEDNEVILIRGEYTSVKPGEAPSVPRTVVLKHHLGWINGNLIFEATPLDVVIKKLELYYDRDFVVSDSSLFARRVTASFDKESLSKVLDVLSVAMDLEYEQNGRSIFLKPYEKEEDGQ